VTHNNLDYLLRMHRANPRAFEEISRIGVHPYHWFRNDVWDDRFVRDVPTAGWTEASPREYAGGYFKRFDFIEEVASCVAGRRVRDRRLRAFARALAGKKIWITEFGIGTKVLGDFNSPIADYTRFIRPRTGVGLAAGHAAAVWEDLWESFLDQADAGYLATNQVDGLLLYSLREAGLSGLDMDDDDRSNMALLHRDGTARIDDRTLRRVGDLLSTVAGGRPTDGHAPPAPGRELHRRPWRAKPLSQETLDAKTMLSIEERQLLAWLAAEHWTGAGAIVDGGCFLGGSTLALAEGVRANRKASGQARIDVFDLFEVEPYMIDLYFPGTSLAAGDSFRGEFDRATSAVADLLQVHEGDLSASGWDGRPIELLFIDIAKTWSLNDVIVSRFFPCLIPDRSVVVQQDYAFAFQPWIAITMEHLSDYFEPVAFAEYNSVVFVCRRTVPRELSLASIADLPDDEKMSLLERSANRFRGYPRSYLEAGRAVLMLERGQTDAALRELRDVRVRFEGDELAQQGAALVEAAIVTPA
jgi:hypothetical protein